MLRLFSAAAVVMLVSVTLTLVTGSWIARVITLALGLLIVLSYLLLQRGLPHRKGRLHLQGLREPVEIYWDNRGIPHIYARNDHDLYMAQGYVTAQDRLWSMEMLRRLSSGRLAEVLGERALALDKQFRTIGLRRVAEASLATHSKEAQECLAAYAAGVNAWIAQGKRPPEFLALGAKPEPWVAADSLAIGKYLAYSLGGNWDRELFRALLVQTVSAEKASELFWTPPDEAWLRELEEIPLPDVTALLTISASTITEAGGSSAWVAAGTRTQSGAPMLASDPHLRVRTPGVWHQAHLIGPDGLDVTGVTFPGVPGIVMGHNREIAWGTANLAADTQDVYIEQRNPAAPDEFRFEDRWEKATRLEEIIRVRGKAEPVRHDVLITRHGPVIAAGEVTALSLRWTALEPSTELDAFLMINRAKSWPEFRQALEHFGAPAQQFLFAGRGGTIARRAAGRLPLRAKADGQAPMPGWLAEYDWTGYVSFEEMPETVNPEDGFLTAGPDQSYRSMRAAERLQTAANLTVESMQALQTDCVNLQARSLLQVLLTAVQEGLRQGNLPETLSEREKLALLSISGWDCSEANSGMETALWHQWYGFVLEGIFRPQMGLTLFDQFLACGLAVPMADRLLREVAEGQESLWLPREGEGGLPRIALRAFRRAVALLAAKQGPKPERWRWDREHTVTFSHPLSAHRKIVQWAFDLGPYPVRGSSNTLHGMGYSQVTPFRVQTAATWRHIVDLAQPDQARDICAPGQSGHPLSPHYADQVTAWLKGEYRPQLFRQNQVQSLERVVLEPGKPA